MKTPFIKNNGKIILDFILYSLFSTALTCFGSEVVPAQKKVTLEEITFFKKKYNSPLSGPYYAIGDEAWANPIAINDFINKNKLAVFIKGSPEASYKTHNFPCFIATLYHDPIEGDWLKFPKKENVIDLIDFDKSTDQTVKNIDQIVTQVYNLLKPQPTSSTPSQIAIVAKIKTSEDPQGIFCFVDVLCIETEGYQGKKYYLDLAKKLNGYTQENKQANSDKLPSAVEKPGSTKYVIGLATAVIAVLLCWNHWDKISSHCPNAIKTFLEKLLIRTTVTP